MQDCFIIIKSVIDRPESPPEGIKPPQLGCAPSWGFVCSKLGFNVIIIIIYTITALSAYVLGILYGVAMLWFDV